MMAITKKKESKYDRIRHLADKLDEIVRESGYSKIIVDYDTENDAVTVEMLNKKEE